MSPLAIQILTTLSPFLIACLSWLGTEAAKLLRNRTRNELLSVSMMRLTDVVVTVVAELEQTMVRELRLRSADGVLSSEDMAAVKAEALRKVKSYLGPAGIALLMKVLGAEKASLEGFISSKIEAAVLAMKMPRAPEPVTLPPFLQGNPPPAVTP